MPASTKTPRRRIAPRRAPIVVPDTAALVAVLQAHALGEYDMTATRVNVALSLLKLYAGHTVKTAPVRSHEDALAELS